MLLKFTSVLFLFTLLPASYAHAGVAPQLGVGTPKRSDVKRPSANQPCGDGVNIASAFDTSKTVQASSNGDVKVTVLNFNAGADGSRKIQTAQVDPSGTGKNFVKMTISGKNGDPAPKLNSGSDDVVAQLPAGTKCTGGAAKNKCLVQFVTTSGFGNCVVVSQGPGAGNNNKPLKARDAGPRIGIVISGRAVDAPAGADKKSKDQGGKKNGGKDEQKKGDGKGKQKKGAQKKGGQKKDGQKKDGQKKSGQKKQAGTRAARALLVDLEGAV